MVHVRQPVAVPLLDGNLAVQAERLDMLPRRRDVFDIGLQAVDEEAVAGPQRRRQLALASADMDDEAALNASGLQDFLGVFAVCDGGRTKEDGEQCTVHGFSPRQSTWPSSVDR